MSAGLPCDHAIRERVASDLERSYVVEAGAGTGKTTLIVRRILSHVRAGHPLSALIATTFTEKAAAELKERVRQELDVALQEPADATTARRLLAARHCVDTAAIQTIHGFCTTLLRERPVEAGLDPGFEVLDGERAADLENEAFEATLEEIDAKSEVGGALAEVLASGVKLADLRSLCCKRIRDRDLACGPLPVAFDLDGTLPEASVPPGGIAVVPAPRPDCGAVLRRLLGAVDELNTVCSASVGDPDDKLATRVRELLRALQSFARLDASALERELARIATRSTKTLGAKGNWRVAGALAEARTQLELVFQAIEEFKQKLRHWRALVLWHVAERCVEHYVSLARARGRIDFHDQLVFTRNLLRDRVDVRRALGKSIVSLIVDEFQDTDPLQAEIAFFLAESLDSEPATHWLDVKIGAGRLVLVGDPKQSIYRFRRADIEIYEVAKQRMSECGGEVVRIVVNFRCAPGVIDFVNQRFSKLIQKADPSDRTQPDYVPLEMPPKPAGNRIGVAVLRQPAQVEFERSEDSRSGEGRAIAGFLDRLVRGEKPFLVVDRHTKQKRPATFKDCAILFRTLDAVDGYEEALKGLDIPYRVAGGKRYFSRAEVRTAIALFRTIDDASDEVALLATLRGPLFTISDSDLMEFVAGGGEFASIESTSERATAELRRAIDRIVALRGMRHELSPSELVESAYAVTRIIEIFSFFPEGPQRVANLEKLLTLARSLQSDQGVGFRAFVEVAARMARERERQAEAEYLDDDDSAVSLLTMHGAKGLEWPIVVLADPSYYPLRTDRFVLERGTTTRFEFCFGEARDRTVATAGIEAALVSNELRATAERRRLFYVAATRARDLLVLSTFSSARRAKGDESRSKSFADDLRDDPAIRGETTEFAHDVDVAALRIPLEVEEPLRVKLDLDAEPGDESRAVLAEREEFVSRKRSSWNRAVVLPLGSEDENRETSEERSGGRRGESRAPRGPEFGTLIHRALERCDLGAQEPPSIGRIRAIARDLGLGDDSVELAREILTEQWSSSFFHDLRRARRRFSEIPFAHVDERGAKQGAIDLLAEFEDGALWIVDWKTDEITADALDARMEQYAEQASRYRRAVEAALGRSAARVCFHFLRLGITREAP